MAEGDEFGFWQPERRRDLTGPIPRLSRPTASPAQPTASPAQPVRRHAVPRPRRTDAEQSQSQSGLDDGHDLWDDFADSVPLGLIPQRSARVASKRPNYLLRRVSVLVALGFIAAPLAMLFDSDDPRSSVADGSITTDQPLQLPTVVPESAAIAAAVAPAPTTAVPPPPSAATPPSSAVATTAAHAVTLPSSTEPATAATPTVVPSVDESPVQSTDTPDTEAASPIRSGSSGANEAVNAEERQVEAAPETVAPTCSSEYEVLPGDYWILIADKVGVSLSDLLEVNGAKTETALYPGRTICMPKDAAVPTTPAPTTVPSKPASPASTSPTTTQATPASTTPASTPASTTAPPTTVASTPQPTTSAAAPKESYTKAEVEAIIRSVWPDNLEDEAVRIATRESGLIPTVRNYCCFGLFQMYWDVHKSWMKDAGVTSSDQLFDPVVNTYIAYSMYLRSGGWGPWT